MNLPRQVPEEDNGDQLYEPEPQTRYDQPEDLYQTPQETTTTGGALEPPPPLSHLVGPPTS